MLRVLGERRTLDLGWLSGLACTGAGGEPGDHGAGWAVIDDLDRSVRLLLKSAAPRGSELERARVSFETPDAAWRASLRELTLSCYLYEVHENRARRSPQRPQVAPIDCGYCITAWSPDGKADVGGEHRLLSQVISALAHVQATAPEQVWERIDDPVRPYPALTTLAGELDAPAAFWGALGHGVKPSVNCVFTVAINASAGRDQRVQD